MFRKRIGRRARWKYNVKGGAAVGASAGVGLGSALVVFGAKLNEKMLELGANPDDPASFERVVREHEEEISNYALKWAAIVGLLDAATAGVGATRLVPRGGAVSHVVEAGAQLATQAGGGAAGEAAGQLATEGELREGEIAAELVTGIFTGAGEVGSLAVTGVRGNDTPVTESAAKVETQDLEADLAPEDTGTALPREALAEEGESGVEAVAGPDPVASVAGTPRDETRRDQYYESSLHEKFRGAAAPLAEAGQAGHNAFGLIDPESGKPIIQPINDADQMLAMAEESVAPLERQIRELAADLPGVEFSGARAKGPDRVAEKLAKGRRPDTLGDYLGGRIVVGDPSMLSEAVRVLSARYKNIEIDNFIKKPREIGYRAIHMQIVLDNGMTAEIQIMPSEILPVYEIDHENYEKWRDIDTFTEEEMNQKEADEAWARKAYAEAYERWLQRGETESTWPKDR